MKKQSIATTYIVRLDGYYQGPIKVRRIARLLDLIGTQGVTYNLGHDTLIITAANNVLNVTEIANMLALCFEGHYLIEKIGEVSC